MRRSPIIFYTVPPPHIHRSKRHGMTTIEQRIVIFSYNANYPYSPYRKSSNAVHLYKDSRYLYLHHIVLSITS